MVMKKIAALLVLFAGCAPRGDSSGEATGPGAVRIAEQHGLAYLPLVIMQVEGLLEEELRRDFDPDPAPAVEWRRTGNASAIREAMLAGHLDIGFMGIPPYLIGVDRGTGWRVFTGLSEAPLGLVTVREGLRSLDDLQPRDRIALPQPGSIQHILLAMASEERYGDPRRFDDRLVSMGHPEGLTALLAGRDVAAQFTAPPFLFSALEDPRGRLLLSGEDAFGGAFTFIIGAAAPDWGKTPREARIEEAFLRALDRAIGLARKVQAGEEQELFRSLCQVYGVEAEVLRAQMDHPGQVYSREVRGFDRFIGAMARYGYLEDERVRDFLTEAAPLVFQATP